MNKGGLKLTNQEIRNCIYSGPFNSLLKSLASSDEFVRLFSIDSKKKYRYSNEELVLRIFAFAEGHQDYKGPLSKYLNSYMAKHRRISDEKALEMKEIFLNAMDILYRKGLAEEPLPRLSKATSEALFVGIINNLALLGEMRDEQIQDRYVQLRMDPLFSISALKEGLAARERVKARLDRAIEIFR